MSLLHPAGHRRAHCAWTDARADGGAVMPADLAVEPADLMARRVRLLVGRFVSGRTNAA